MTFRHEMPRNIPTRRPMKLTQFREYRIQRRVGQTTTLNIVSYSFNRPLAIHFLDAGRPRVWNDANLEICVDTPPPKRRRQLTHH